MGWQRQIAQRIGRGETAALAELYDRVAGRVYRVAIMMTSSSAAAEQITQAVFVQAWNRPNTLLRHQDRLADHFIHQACQRGVLWRAQHESTDRPTASHANSRPPAQWGRH